MSGYVSFFRLRMNSGLQYRVAALAGVVTQFFWGFLRILLIQTFTRTAGTAAPLGTSQLAAYIWLNQAFLALLAPWILDGDTLATIIDGNVAYELVRPVDLYGFWFVKSFALRLSRALLRCLPILLVAIWLPKPFTLPLPSDPVRLALFILSLSLAALSVVALYMLLYVLTFYTLSPLGVRIVMVTVFDFLSGGTIPLPYFPPIWQKVLSVTPFPYLGNLPFLVYGGAIDGRDLASSLIIQAVWLIVLIVGGSVAMRAALRRVVVQGG